MNVLNLPTIIQGGMGVGISDWELAKTVALHGQLGVVSGTGVNLLLISRLMRGDLDGKVRRALSHFPFQDSVKRIMDKYFVPGGVPEAQEWSHHRTWPRNTCSCLNHRG